MTEEKERELFDSIIEIRCDIKQIKADLADDYKILHGNGRAGLIERMTIAENNQRWAKTIAGICGIAGSAVLRVISALLGVDL